MTTIRRHQKFIRQKGTSRHEVEGKIIETCNQGDLSEVLQPEVQAVIYRPSELQSWMKDLARAVESGDFHIERVILQRVTTEEIGAWLQKQISQTAVLPELSSRFQSEIQSLVDLERELTGATRFMVRMITEAPTQRCGFHIDTALPRAPTIGLLWVFNGPGTLYVHPENIISMGDFYRYVGQRERLGKELGKAGEESEILRKIAALENNPGFMYDADDIRAVPEGAIVAFKHLDVRYHWSDHPKGMTWIHCSPSQGPARLVINITAWDSQAV